jgi:hypothetical protein
VVIAAIPLPSFAGEGSQPVARPGIRASAAKIATTAPLAAAQSQAGPDKASLNSGSFFKSPAGIVVLAVVAAGAGYALYSAKNDRIQSVTRAKQ